MLTSHYKISTNTFLLSFDTVYIPDIAATPENFLGNFTWKELGAPTNWRGKVMLYSTSNLTDPGFKRRVNRFGGGRTYTFSDGLLTTGPFKGHNEHGYLQHDNESHKARIWSLYKFVRDGKITFKGWSDENQDYVQYYFDADTQTWTSDRISY